MRVAQLAELAGTTVRTVRHYHAIGLLPVPETVDGWRDYDVTHLARLVRIRRLVQAGLGLDAIGTLLDATAADARGDLQAVLAGMDAQIAELTERRERLAALLANLDLAADDDAPATSPLPPVVASFYSRLEARAQDPATLRAVRRERAFTEAAYCRGVVPPEAEVLYAAHPVGLDETLASFARIERSLSDADVQEHAAEVVARMKAAYGAALDDVARNVDPEQVRRMYDLYLASAQEPERRVGLATRDLVLAELAARRQR